MNGWEWGRDWQSLFAGFCVVLLIGFPVGMHSGVATASGGHSSATAGETGASLADTDAPISSVTAQSNESTGTENETAAEGESGHNATSSNESLQAQTEFRGKAARSQERFRVPADNQIRVGETIALGFKHDGSDCLTCNKYNYDWSVVNGDDDQLLHQSTDEMADEIAQGGRINTFRPTSPGEYEIKVERTEQKNRAVRGNEEETDTKRAYITVTEADDYFDGMSRHELLKRYSPVVNFHPDEDFYPTRYEAYVENSKLKEDDLKFDPKLVPGAGLLDLRWEEGADRLPATGEPDPYLNPETSSDSAHAHYQQSVVDHEYPQTIYGSVTENVEYDGNNYTALGYWMVYIHDPKPDSASWIASKGAHTGDQEGFVVLINESGPQWIAAQQHFGGELRRYDRIETFDNRPEVYVGEGSHPTFFGPRTGNFGLQDGSDVRTAKGYRRSMELEYLYQQQYLCNGDGGPSIMGEGCQASGAGSPQFPRIFLDYTDPMQAGTTWYPEDYEVTTLTGEEAWSDYDGSVYRYLGLSDGPTLRVSLIPSGNTLNDGAMERFLNLDRSPKNQREAFPSKRQIRGIISPANNYDVEYGLDGKPKEVEVKVQNTGFQPHEYVVGQQGEPETKRDVFVRTGEVQYSGAVGTVGPFTYFEAGEGTAMVPVTVDGDGPWEVTSELSRYPNSTVLDTATFQLESGPSTAMQITENDGTAGSAGSPQPVSQTVSIERNGNPYTDFVSATLWNVEVGGKTVELDDISVSYGGPQNEYTLTYTPPTQPSSGAYDLNISLDDGPTAHRSDAITYSDSDNTGVQVAANIQIDRSGSMGNVIDEAKEGGATFVEQSDDDDYISVVSYANNARTEQSLVELSDGRRDTIDAIEGISAYGGTNIGASLESGLDSLDSAPEGTTKAAILMTDGKRNDGPSEQQILDDIVPRYNEQGVCLYTIGFGSDADEPLLQDIADAADCGEYRFAGEEGDVDSINQTLQSVYQDLGGEVSDAETIASESGTIPGGNTTTGQFVVDASVVQTTTNLQIDGLVDPISPAPNLDEPQANIQLAPDTGQSDEIRLVRPDGTVLNTSDANVSKSVVGDTVIYRIQNPQPGNWTYELRNTQKDTTQYSVDVSGEARTELAARASAETYSSGSQGNVTATLVGPEGGISNATIVGNVTLPDGNSTMVDFDEQSAGVYTASLTLEQAGSYTIEVAATGQNQSVSRQTTVTVTADETPSLSLHSSNSSAVVRGNTSDLPLRIGAESDSNVTVELSALTAVNGTATIPATQVEPETNSLAVAGGDTRNLNVSVIAPEWAPSGVYEGTVRAYRDNGLQVSDRLTMTVLDPATFEVTSVNSTAPVDAGQPLDVTVEVTNTGDRAGQQNVTALLPELNVTATTPRTVALASGNSTTLTFTLPTEKRDNGTHGVAAVTEDDRNATSVDLKGPAFADLETYPYVVMPADDNQTMITADVENTGDETTSQDVELIDGSQTVATTSVTLAPDEVRRVNFTYQTNATDVGTQLRVRTTNSSSTVTLIDTAASYANTNRVVDTRGLELALTDWRTDEISRAVLDDVLSHWASGDPVVS